MTVTAVTACPVFAIAIAESANILVSEPVRAALLKFYLLHSQLQPALHCTGMLTTG